jgi:hypothetical protein
MIERAIAERIARNVKRKKDEPSAEELLKKLNREELYNFIVRLIQNNPDLSNAVLLEFSDKIDSPNGKKGNKYVSIIRQALDSYTEQYTGRMYYEHIVTVFGMMKKIPGGVAMVKDMTERYGAVYKNRRAMMEILNRKR